MQLLTFNPDAAYKITNLKNGLTGVVQNGVVWFQGDFDQVMNWLEEYVLD